MLAGFTGGIVAHQSLKNTNKLSLPSDIQKFNQNTFPMTATSKDIQHYEIKLINNTIGFELVGKITNPGLIPLKVTIDIQNTGKPIYHYLELIVPGGGSGPYIPLGTTDTADLEEISIDYTLNSQTPPMELHGIRLVIPGQSSSTVILENQRLCFRVLATEVQFYREKLAV